MTTDNELAAAVANEAAHELASALIKIKHCLGQLSEQQLWWRSRPDLNSIGNLILHLCGNLRQWIVAGLEGADDGRDRPAEFAERGPIAKEDLVRSLDTTVGAATQVLRGLTVQQLLQPRRIQGFDVSGLGAIFNSLPHFRGHTQEIVHMTRVQLGDAYQYQWTPTMPEPGAGQASTSASGSPGALSIRACQLEDVQAVLDLWRQADATPSVTDSAADLGRAIADGPAIVLVADLKGRLIGSIIGTFDGWRGNIYRLVVHPDFRRQGVARALVAEVERQLSQRGTRRITALVEKEHPWATGFWQAVGYGHDERIVRHVRNLSR